MKTCNNCGNQSDNNASFCNNCGSSFEMMQISGTHISNTQPSEQPSQPQTQSAQPYQPQPQTQHPNQYYQQQPYGNQQAYTQQPYPPQQQSHPQQAYPYYQAPQPHQSGALGGMPTLQHISGKPSFVFDLILLIFNIIIDISLLITGQLFWFFGLLVFTAIPIVRLSNTLRSGVFVDSTGVSGKIKKEQFRYSYHEISSVSVDDQVDNKRLVIVSGYHSHSIRVGNARAVRDAISHNMAVLGVIPAPMATPLANALHTADFPAVEITDILRQQIVNIYRHEITGKGRFENFYVFEETPPEKLEHAIKNYAQSLGSDEKIVFLFDSSFTSSGKSGFMLTSKCLYVKDNLEKSTKVYVKNISKVTEIINDKYDKDKITVELETGNYIKITMSDGPEQKMAVIRVLDETIRLMNNPQ